MVTLAFPSTEELPSVAITLAAYVPGEALEGTVLDIFPEALDDGGSDNDVCENVVPQPAGIVDERLNVLEVHEPVSLFVRTIA
jgi:hypothetical protein